MVRRCAVRGAQVRVLAVAAILLAAACGRGGPRTEPRPAVPPPAASNQINPMSRDRVKDGGTLTWAFDLMPANFNVNQLDGPSVNGYSVVWAVMPVAYDNAADGTPLWNHALFASEPKLVTEPAQVMTYEINPRATWSDGTPITWQDFYWQWKAVNGTDKRFQVAGTDGYDRISNVARGTSDREVIVTMRTRYSGWQSLFTPLYPASTDRNPDVFNSGWKTDMPVTAGPFRFAGIDQTAKTITVVRNGKWWGPPAKLDRIVYRVIDPDAQIDALANGEIDLMDVGADASKLNRARGVSTAEVRTAAGPNFVHLDFEGQSPILQDLRVRRAVAMGIDRAAIARALLGPLGAAPAVLNNHVFMANRRGYQDNSGDVGRFDQARAAQLLDEAGWALHDGVRMKDGKPLELRFVIPTGTLSSRQSAELVQNMLARIGVTIRIDTVPISDFFPKYVIPGQFDLTLFSWYETPYPLTSMPAIYGQPKRGADGQLDVRENFSRIGSDEIDRLFDEAAQELDPMKSIAIGNRIDALIWHEVHSVTLYQRPEMTVCKKGLANMGAIGMAFEPVFADIGWEK